MATGSHARRDYNQAGIPSDLAKEVLTVLKKHPWLGKHSLSDVATRALQEWLASAYQQIQQRETLLGTLQESGYDLEDDEDDRRA